MLEKISRFYLSKKTFLVAIIAAMVLGPIGIIMELTLNDIIPFELISYGILFLLLIGLFITHHKEDHILMNGIISGILIYEFVNYAYLITYFTRDVALSYYRSAGFLGCFCFAFIFVTIAAVCLITYNHFTLNRSRAVNRTKIVLNQFLLFLSFFAPIILIAVEYTLVESIYEIATYAVTGFSNAFLLLVVACCELELSINQKDETALKEAPPSDVKAVLWYAFSFLFALLCLIMTILLSNINALVFVLSIINLLLSLGLLIYYLNKKRKPSPKFRICLFVGLITTIGVMVFSVGYFIWTILS